MQMIEGRDRNLAIIRVTKSLLNALKRIMRERGKNFEDRM
jgi:hypothetical protein